MSYFAFHYRSYNFKEHRIDVRWSHNDSHIDFYIRAAHLGYIGFGLGETSGMQHGEFIGLMMSYQNFIEYLLSFEWS